MTKSRFLSIEFMLYYTIISSILLYSLHACHQLWNHPLFQQRIQSTGIFDLAIDLEDHQWRTFRQAIPQIAGLYFGLYILGKFTWQRVQNVTNRIRIQAIIALGSIFLMHGVNTIKILAIIITSYTIAKFTAGSKLCPILTWSFVITLLIQLKTWDKQYRFDSSYFHGFFAYWTLIANFNLLRLISFNMDWHYEVLQQRSDTPIDIHSDCKACLQLDGTHSNIQCTKARLEGPLAIKESDSTKISHHQHRTLVNLLAYSLYPPLYMAGPILTFNDYLVQMLHYKKIAFPIKTTLIYGLRWLIVSLAMEASLYWMPVMCAKEMAIWNWQDASISISKILSAAFWNLVTLWLKLLLIWRFARFWTLMDGLVVGENMIRCMANNYSPSSFWRAWHRTFNVWVIRYMYIPMGGSKFAQWNVWPIFIFVALWHDLEKQLFYWALTVCASIIPEPFIEKFAIRLRLSERLPCYRLFKSLLCIFSISMLMVVNLIGFVTGWDGIANIFKRLADGSTSSIGCIISIAMITFAGSQVQFEIRASERRRGIHRNY